MSDSEFSHKLSYFQCPLCRNDGLDVHERDNRSFQCRNCGAAYPIIRGVPRFVLGDNYAGSFGMQWNIHSRTQLDSFTGKPISRDRLFAASQWPQDLSGEVILEAGSGAGRFTEVLATTGATVLSFDLSSAVDANYSNNGHRQNLLIFQASILDIPLRPESMDKVICLGVIQHTPDPAQTFRNLTRYVRPGGELVIDVYASRLTSLVSWKYLLRPLTKRINGEKLYAIIANVTPKLLPASAFLARALGRFGLRLMPIVHYPHLNLEPEVASQWAILDTFDMYSPAHDHPQSVKTVRTWFDQSGFVEVSIGYGSNGIVARGRRPAS